MNRDALKPDLHAEGNAMLNALRASSSLDPAAKRLLVEYFQVELERARTDLETFNSDHARIAFDQGRVETLRQVCNVLAEPDAVLDRLKRAGVNLTEEV